MHEDEFRQILEGELVLFEDDRETVLHGCECSAFPEGTANDRHLINRSNAVPVYMEFGSRVHEDLTTRAARGLRDQASALAR